MAKKPKAEETAAKPSEVAPQTGEKKLRSLMNAARSAYKDSLAISGAYGEKIANAVEHDHLHKKAWASVVAEDRMTPEKLAEFYDAQEYYRDVLGLNERAKSAPRLRLEGGEEETEEEADAGDAEAKPDPKVAPFPKPASVAAE